MLKRPPMPSAVPTEYLTEEMLIVNEERAAAKDQKQVAVQPEPAHVVTTSKPDIRLLHADLANLLRFVRKKEGRTQANLAFLMKKKQSAICRYEDQEYTGHTINGLIEYLAPMGYVLTIGVEKTGISKQIDAESAQAVKDQRRIKDLKENLHQEFKNLALFHRMLVKEEVAGNEQYIDEMKARIVEADRKVEEITRRLRKCGIPEESIPKKAAALDEGCSA